jgi:hypothetical protein
MTMIVELTKSIDAINAEIKAYQELEGFEQNECHKDIVIGLKMAIKRVEHAFNWSKHGGISGYLHSLDYEQLQNAKNIVESIIKKKDDETRVKIWHVSARIHTTKWFREYDEAEQYLLDNMARFLKERAGKPSEFELDYKMVIPSELPEYFTDETPASKGEKA